MQKHPLLSVKEAAELLRLDERSVRERLINGQLKGEKKQVGLRDKWFVYRGAIEAALAKQQGNFQSGGDVITDVTVEAESHQDRSSEADAEVIDDTESDTWLEENRDKVKVLAEEIVKPLIEKIESQQELIFTQKQTITEQDRQLRLLPDLQKQAEQRAEEVELKHVEIEALKKQIAAMEEEKQELAAKAGEAGALAQDLEALKTKVEELQKPWWKKMFQGQ